uniref:Uncharacterized protein n=1 Tax=Pseudomonas phage RVTF4 TaxID=3236931 RepID=A0AB39CCE7_9VIRU
MLSNIFIVIMIFAFFWLAWKISVRIMVPVNTIQITGAQQEFREGFVRRIERIELKTDKGHPLYAGNNDFYVTIQKGKVKYHSRYVLDTITPIIRDAEDILFFRIQVKTVNGKVVKFNQTNLSQPNVTLQWRTKEG